MPVVYLVRHGQASYGAEDYDVLSPIGHEQSAVVGRELQRRGITSPQVVCGDLVRQRNTALGIIDSARFESTMTIDPRWNEFDHPDMPLPTTGAGDSSDFQRRLDTALESWVREDNLDGWRGFQDRSFDALMDFAGTLTAGATGLAVTSGGVVSAIVSRIWGLDAQGTVRINRVVANTSLTSIVFGRQGMNLLSVNDHSHLQTNRNLLTYR
ncbi:MAG: histidine phosphatase family protein [Actinobacteria bacterium]|nr:histidine phosphatase family protein [Actinomycetota bacterium]